VELEKLDTASSMQERKEENGENKEQNKEAGK
jgi:hypothetical protein